MIVNSYGIVEFEKNMVVYTQFNNDIFYSRNDFFDNTRIVIEDFFKSKFNDFMDFINDSCENNSYLSDYIVKCDFNIKKDTIKFKNKCILDYFDIKDKKPSLEKYINMGKLIIDSRYTINICNSYWFIKDEKTNKKYMYYGD